MPAEENLAEFHVEILKDAGAAWEEAERELAEAGVSVPLPHRCAWAREEPEGASWFIAVRDARGRCECGFAAQLTRSRALPGNRILRVERFGAAASAAARDAGLAALVQMGRRDPRILRIHLEVFLADGAEREAVGRAARRLGLARAGSPRSYAHTVLVDLRPDEGAILAAFHSTARRHIRAVARHPVEVRPLRDPALAPRLDELLAETLTRTGGRPASYPWPRILKLSRTHPSLSRVVGLFRTDREGPEALLAFAWGCAHGDQVEYNAAASTRNPEVRLPMAYALAWDLMRWGKSTGAEQFDFGGITAGTHGEEDRLGGISDFKRYFTTMEREVGAEWVLEPRPLRAAVASAVSAGAAWASRLAHR